MRAKKKTMASNDFFHVYQILMVGHYHCDFFGAIFCVSSWFILLLYIFLFDPYYCTGIFIDSAHLIHWCRVRAIRGRLKLGFHQNSLSFTFISAHVSISISQIDLYAGIRIIIVMTSYLRSILMRISPISIQKTLFERRYRFWM